MRRILLYGWKPGLNKIGLNHLLREQAGLTLSIAKASVDRLLEGDEVSLEINDDSIDCFVDAAKHLGVDAQVVDHVA